MARDDSGEAVPSSSQDGPTKAEKSPGILVGNLGEPLKLADVKLDGVAVESARPGEKLKVCVRASMTSDDVFSSRSGELKRRNRPLCRKGGHGCRFGASQ